MGTVVRCVLVIIGVTLWLMFAFNSVDSLMSRRRVLGRWGPIIIDRRYMDQEDVQKTPYTNCGDDVLGEVSKVEVEGCNDDPCQLVHGKSATVNIEFKSNVKINSLHAVVYGIVAGIPVRFHVPQEDACHDSGLVCPIKPHQKYNYNATIPIRNSYPRIEVQVKWELVNEDNKILLCVLIPAKIV